MVILILGSISDRQWASEIEKYLQQFKLTYKIHISSAHKTPEYLLALLKKYEKLAEKKVYICIAGRSNALGGFVDSATTSPVINCPPPSDKYAGLDILSSLRMPSGVAPLTVLEPDQAALAAAKILTTSKKDIDKILSYQGSLKGMLINEDKKLQKSGN